MPETADYSLSTRTQELAMVAQVIRSGHQFQPEDLGKLQPIIDRVLADPKTGARTLRNLALAMKTIEGIKLSQQKLEIERARMQMEAERIDCAKVALGLKSHQLHVPLAIFGTAAAVSEPTSVDARDELDRLIDAAETPEEHDVIERLLERAMDDADVD